MKRGTIALAFGDPEAGTLKQREGYLKALLLDMWGDAQRKMEGGREGGRTA